MTAHGKDHPPCSCPSGVIQSRCVSDHPVQVCQLGAENGCVLELNLVAQNVAVFGHGRSDWMLKM
jgi:hypothetical protein